MYRPFPTVRVIPGAECEYLDAHGLELLEFQDFTISNSSIQLLPDGQLIVLMADHQTTGGYPRIAHIITRDLPLIAHLGANDKVAFHLVDIAHAEELALEFERDLSFLRVAAKMLR